MSRLIGHCIQTVLSSLAAACEQVAFAMKTCFGKPFFENTSTIRKQTDTRTEMDGCASHLEVDFHFFLSFFFNLIG